MFLLFHFKLKTVAQLDLFSDMLIDLTNVRKNGVLNGSEATVSGRNDLNLSYVVRMNVEQVSSWRQIA